VRKAVLILACTALAALIVIHCWAGRVPVQPITNVTIPDHQKRESPAAQNKPLEREMVFSSDGLPGRLLRTAEGVAGSGNAKVAVSTQGQARLVCILTAGMARHYSLDDGLEPGQFAFIQSQNFTQPNSHVLQTMSIYRSLAKTEMGFSAEQGDRMIVLTCPKEDWSSLQLQWPEHVKSGR
jgi:hypothetical protein